MNDLNYRVVFDQKHLGMYLNLPEDYTNNVEDISKDTPEDLKYLSHYAAAWGIDDDGYRRDFIMRAPELMKKISSGSLIVERMH